MKGYEIRQVVHHGLYYRLAIIKIDERGLGLGSFSKIKSLPNGQLWNSTVRSISSEFKLEFL